MTTHRCGCLTAPDPSSGVVRSVAKCPGHRRDRLGPASLDGSYYAQHVPITPDGLGVSNHVAEIAEALGPFPAAPPGGMCLEVGCGVSPYVWALRGAGWDYRGLDPSPWAARWMGANLRAPVFPLGIEQVDDAPAFGLILAAHSLEHLDDAPAALAKMGRLLLPGGELWAVVPHGEDDPTNPDHVFFFTSETLRACAESAGLEVLAVETRRVIAKERFVYLRAARRPGPQAT